MGCTAQGARLPAARRNTPPHLPHSSLRETLTCLHRLCPVHRGPKADTAELAEYPVCETEVSLSPALLHGRESGEMSVLPGGEEKLSAALLHCRDQGSSFLPKNHPCTPANLHISNCQTYTVPLLLTSYSCGFMCQRSESPPGYVSSSFMRFK